MVYFAKVPEPGRVKTGDDVRVRVERVEDSLEVRVSDYNGLWGDAVYFRISSTKEGRVSVRSRSNWYTDVVGPTLGRNGDLHGDVRIEARAAADAKPLKLAFRLCGLELRPGSVRPMRIEGAVEVPLDSMDWSPLLGTPAWRTPGRKFSEAD